MAMATFGSMLNGPWPCSRDLCCPLAPCEPVPLYHPTASPGEDEPLQESDAPRASRHGLLCGEWLQPTPAGGRAWGRLEAWE